MIGIVAIKKMFKVRYSIRDTPEVCEVNS